MGIAAYGESDSITIGGRKLTAINKLLILKGFTNGSTNKFGSFRSVNGTAGYQVPNGKKLVVLGVRTTGNYVTATNEGLVSLYYSDNDNGIGTSTTPTNQVYQCGDISPAAIGSGANSAGDSSSYAKFEEATYFEVPAGKYLGCTNLGGNQSKWHQAYCYLEDA
jgi:hypothetical protein